MPVTAETVDLLATIVAQRSEWLSTLIEHMCPDISHTVYTYQDQIDRILRNAKPLGESDV